LVLHDPVWYDHIPYLPFPETWPVFPPKDKFADWLESYASILELNVWTSTTLSGQPKYDETTKLWTVTVTRPDGTQKTIRPKHLIIATSITGEPNIPTFKGTENFKRPILHSTQFKNGADYAQKKVVIIGSCTSAIDIAQDLYEQGAEPTLVQRSSTYIITSQAFLDVLFKGVYDGTGPPTDIADLLSYSLPNLLAKTFHVGLTALVKQQDAALLDAVEKAGFKLDFGVDDSGLLPKFLIKGGGYYIDVGGADLIAEGKIKVKQGQEVDHFEKDGVVFADGSKLEADGIVLATGYQGMKSTIAKILGEEVAARTSDVWGLDEEGEIRGMWKATGHPGLWYHGGNLALCRFFSRRLALQIKAQLVGLYEEQSNCQGRSKL